MNTIVQIFPYAVAYTIPLLITSLGGLFSERSGVVNIGLEGLMVVGSFFTALVINFLEPTMGANAIWFGLLAAMIGGALFSMLHAIASVSLHANQVISGTAINMIATAVTVFFARNLLGSGNIQIINTLSRFNVPLLSRIPIIGPLFFTNTYATTWFVLAILGAAYFVLYYTPSGLRLRSCGEHPHAADAAGINVQRTRYIGVGLSGTFAGLGGGVMIVTYSGQFNGSVAGLGFLALASLIFGQWKPLGILGATLFFGFATTMANVSQVIPSLAVIPPVLLKTFPYVATLIALIIFSRSSQAPKAVGEPFVKDKR
ncbi:ABC transporter permease [Spirochaeta lutea]|uniref:Sugar ABC transporter permease n=1 Tax=Spirochaeta lutea TaxID=1480694 RepID=A0A098R4C7_9SPIO|nr:ABC transporter permease [Spirochaeta lutea]KGE73622.1 sugar ABC transporter permease [Spirochaeta lutea]